MQAKAIYLRTLLIVLVASLFLGGCFGASSGRVWFNLPSIPLMIQEDGTAEVFGIALPQPILQPAQVQQFVGGGLDKLEVRIGYNGIHVYANGKDLPYIEWDEAKAANLGEVLKVLPQVPNGAQVASALPWLRKIGLGVALHMPGSSGNSPGWSGETEVSEASGGESTIGPLKVGMLAYDDAGNASVAGMSAASLGLPLPTLPDNVLGILSALGAEALDIQTHPQGIHLTLNEMALPGIAYDKDKLDALLEFAPAFGVDEATMGTLAQVLPILPGADIQANVSFTGEPAIESVFAPIDVKIMEDGTGTVFGVPLGDAPLLDAEMLGNLQAANVQQLDVELGEGGLFLAANGQALPQITWTEDSLDIVAGIVGPMAGMDAAGMGGILDIARGAGLSTVLQLPVAAGAEAIEVSGEISRDLMAADLGDISVPTIHLTADVDDSGAITSLGGMSPEDLGPLGAALALPADTVAMLADLGADTINISTDANQLNVGLDGETALSLAYDVNSLQAALDLAAPFLGDSPLSNPTIAKLISEQILPLIPGSDLDVTLNLN